MINAFLILTGQMDYIIKNYSKKNIKEISMEKVLWVKSHTTMKGAENGLDEVNKYLEQGWKVKLISACAVGDTAAGQAYIVIEK